MNTELQEITKGFPSVIEIPVAWGEMDAAQHVNNIVYLRYSETGRIDYLEKLSFGIDTNNPESALGPILAEVACRYKMPLVFPDKVLVATRIDLDTVEEYSFMMEQRIISQKHQRIAAEVKAKIVSYDYQQLRKAPIPAILIEKIRAYQAD